MQETTWKESKARNIGGGCKIFYHGEDGRRNAWSMNYTEGRLHRESVTGEDSVG